MPNVVLIDSPSGAPSLAESLRPGLRAAGLDVEVWNDEGAALDPRKDTEARAADPAAVVLGPGLSTPLAVARRVRAADPHVQIVFLLDADQEARLRRQMSVAPLIGSQWCIARPGHSGTADVIRQAAAATRQRRSLRTTLDRFNLRLASSTPPDAARVRKLLLSERQLAHVLRHAQDAILTMDERGVIQTWNHGAERMLGLAEAEALGRPLGDVAGAAWKEKTQALLNRLRATDQPILEDIFCDRLHGAPLYVSLSLSSIMDETGHRVALCAIARDITERKRLEQRFQASVESAPTAMVMTAPSGRIVLVNAETEKLFGYARDELIGQSVERLVPERFRPQHPTDRAAFVANPEARPMGAGRDLFGLRKDGSEFPVEIGLNPIETDEGLFVLSAIVDITVRKRLEATRQQLNEELAAANEALTRSNLDLQQFASVASHDLQAPLVQVGGFAHLLRATYRGKLDDEADLWIGYIVDGVERMQRLIRDLLTLARVESQSRPFEPVALGAAADDAVELLAASITDTGAQVTHDALPTVVADRPQMVQLLQNLIGNGLKYHGDAPPRVHVSAERSDPEWIISVRDNGIGIASEDHERIFEIFSRLHTQDAYPGTGIGLAVCRRIVQRHGGRLWVESEAGAGATFRFTLPDAKAANS